MWIMFVNAAGKPCGIENVEYHDPVPPQFITIPVYQPGSCEMETVRFEETRDPKWGTAGTLRIYEQVDGPSLPPNDLRIVLSCMQFHHEESGDPE